MQHAWANSTRRRNPPESVSTRSCRRSARPSRVSISSARVRSSRPPQSVQPAVVIDVLDHRELLVDARRLKHDAELRRIASCSNAQVEAQDVHLALLQRNQRREHAEERRLAAAVGAEEREDFARGDGQRQIVDRLVLAVAVGQVGNLDGGRVGHGRSDFPAGRIPMASAGFGSASTLVSTRGRMLLRPLPYPALRRPTLARPADRRRTASDRASSGRSRCSAACRCRARASASRRST